MQATFKPTVEFSVPPTNTQQPGTSSQAAPSARHTTATQEAISHVLSRVRSALNIDPPALPRPDPDAQLVAFDVQPHGLLHPTDPPVPHLLCACALADDTLAMYDLFEQRWSAHKLSNTQQKRVACVRWQPQSGSILAVSCARGVCIWRLAFSGDNELAGGHLVRVVEIFGGPEAFPFAAPTLRWHPLGSWLAVASPRHGGVALCELASTAAAATIPFHSSRLSGLLHSIVAAAAGSSVHTGGVSALEISPCGQYMMVAGSRGGVRVYSTREWQWDSWPRLGTHAPVVAAAWHGPPPLSPDPSLRTLIVALQGEGSVHIMRVGKRANGLGAGSLASEYVGHVDVSHLAPSPTLAGGGARACIAALSWEPSGERLVVGWSGHKPDESSHKPDESSDESSPSSAAASADGVTVLATRTTPSFQAHALGDVSARVGDGARVGDVRFAYAFEGRGGAGSGAVLAVGSTDGHVALVPLVF